ncbi:MAG: sugar phosphate isomerase/epimerase family protein [Granulicella sp.]
MRRREFIGAALSTGLLYTSPLAKALSNQTLPISNAGFAPMALGLLIKPARDPEAIISRVKELGIPTCFLSLDDYIGKFNKSIADQLGGLLHKYGIVPTAAEVVGPGKLTWDFIHGPATIGIVPRATRAARVDALKQTSDFAKMLGIPNVQTHCGFIPEDPADPLYEEAVLAIRELAEHCAGNGQSFLMETGQETPTTVSRTIKDVDRPSLGVGLDTANLILYGKANPSDAVDILGPHIRSVHAKDGKWPTDPDKLGQEVLIGAGLVDFKQVFTKLHKVGYRGAISIERETSGPKQIEDVKQEKIYLERILGQIQKSSA